MLVREAVARVRRHLGGDKDTRNRLSAAATAVAGSLELEFDGPVSPGTVLEVNAERMYVWAYNEGPPISVDVERGFDGTEPAAHSVGDLVAVDPRFPGVVDALSNELEVLASDGLFQMVVEELEFDWVLGGVDLADIVGDPLNIYGVEITPALAPVWLRSTDWFEDRTTLRLSTAPKDGLVRVHYTAPFGALGGSESDVGATGLPVYAHELLTVGAAVCLLAGKEAGRVDFESSVGQRRPEEVEPGHSSLAVRMLSAKRQALLGSALARQEQLFPTRTA